MANQNLMDIEKQSLRYAEARDVVARLVGELDDGVRALKAERLPELRRAMMRAQELQAKLKGMVEQAPELFVKPQSHTTHGIKYGYQKGKGSLEISSASEVVKRIYKHLPEQADVLVEVEHKLNKAALIKLPGDVLKKLGVTVVNTGTAVFVRAVDGDVEKLAETLLRDDEAAK